MIHKTIFLFAFLLFSGLAQSQRLGFEFQAYPTGLIPGIRYADGWGERHEWNLRLGLNLIDHRDLGVKWDEQGWGYGASLGYRYYFKPDWRGFFIGPRLDLWHNHIDWVDILPNDAQVSGTTQLLVVQPTAEAGYQWVFGNWTLAPSIAFGVEINAVTEGEETGQGAILLLGISLSRRL